MKNIGLLLVCIFCLQVAQSARADIAPGFENWHACTADYQCYSNRCGCNGGTVMQCLPDETYPEYCCDTCSGSNYVHRFWSPVFKSHFYTIDENEYLRVKNYDSNWIYEGVAFNAFKSQINGTVPVYRFWSPVFKKHFYTAKQAEYQKISASDGNWIYEKIAFYAYSRDYSDASWDVYRFWSPAYGNSHFYTKDLAEYQKTLQDPYWSLEDIEFRVPRN